MIEPEPVTDRRMTAGGLEVATVRWPGDGSTPGVLLVHGTSLCKEVWQPLVAALRARGFVGPVLAVDQPGHGASDAPGGPDWTAIGDAVGAAAHESPGAWVGVGHSSGSTGLVLAAADAPDRFTHLVLFEPIVVPPGTPVGGSVEMAERTRRRRARFESREEARARFGARLPFSRWNPLALDGYLAGGLRPDPDGAGLILACAPDFEAGFYAAGPPESAWHGLVALRTPTTLVVGAETDPHHRVMVEIAATQLAAGEAPFDVRETPGSHFAPFEHPAALADLVLDAVKTCAGVESRP